MLRASTGFFVDLPRSLKESSGMCAFVCREIPRPKGSTKHVGLALWPGALMVVAVALPLPWLWVCSLPHPDVVSIRRPCPSHLFLGRVPVLLVADAEEPLEPRGGAAPEGEGEGEGAGRERPSAAAKTARASAVRL